MSLNYNVLATALPLIYQKRGVESAWSVYVASIGLQLNTWQQSDIASFFEHHQCCWNYNRGAGKTEKMSHLAVFGTLIGKDVDWIASGWAQLNQAQKYWQVNPYVVPFKISKQRVFVELITGDIFDTYAATENNIRGKRGEWVFYDEVSRFDAETFNVSLQIANHVEEPFRLMSSTPVLASLFHDLTKKYPTFHHTYLECGWMNHTEIESQKMDGFEWLWEQENLAKFVLPSGRVFPNLIEYNGIPPNCVNITQGVDFNAVPGHTLIRIGFYDEKLWILAEETYIYKRDDDLLQDQIYKYPTEVESGGWNDTYAPHLVGCTNMPFTESSKAERIGWLLQQPIMVNKTLTPHIYHDLVNAVWTEKGKVDTGDLHFLASLMHSVRTQQAIIDIPSNRQRLRRRIFT